jgi:hypothetical protein
LVAKKAALKQVEVIRRRLKVIDLLLKNMELEEKEEKKSEVESEEEEEEKGEKKKALLPWKRVHGHK